MHPEDIIQQKEWNELNEIERQSLLPLATTEQEYNMLKKMFLIVDEEINDVPLINPAIQQNLQSRVKPQARTFSLKTWHYAAATVVLLFAAWFFIQRNNKQPSIAKTLLPLRKTIDLKPRKEIYQEDTITYVQTPSTKHIKKNRYQPTINKNDYASVSTLVNDDRSLLEFTTEVY